MQTPEEFAITATEPCPTIDELGCKHRARSGTCIDLAAAADLIRARDAEVRADERAKVRQWLAEYTGPDPMVGLDDLRKLLVGEP